MRSSKGRRAGPGAPFAVRLSTAWIVGLCLLAPAISVWRAVSDTGRPDTLQSATNVHSAKPGDHNFTIKTGGLDRHYTVHVPRGYNGRTPVPVVVMLHGGGGSGRAAAVETGWDVKADDIGFIAVFPEALPPDPARSNSFARNPQLWNDGSERFYRGQKKVDDVGFLNAMLDEISARFAVDARRVFFTGFSNGASMVFRFAAEAPRRVTAIAPVAGACWIAPGNMERPVSMCYITGLADPLNLIEGGVPRLLNGASDPIRAKPKPPVRESILKWATALGCPSAAASVTGTEGVRTEILGPGRGGAEVIFITVEDLGHTWPGGSSLLPESMVGKRTARIRATDVIWAFFQKHSGSKAGGQGERT
ncbi:MAG: hypothetical protein C0404_04260 [Verrucomicrobia bacterium]|nr:hypothetical protein [Verrucomicrobiota bacterium]